MVQKSGKWKGIQTVLRYAHYCAESLSSGVEVLDRVPDEKISTILAQSHDKRAIAWP